MNLILKLCILCISVTVITGCMSTPLVSPFPTNPDFKSAEENFLNGNYNEAISFYHRYIAAQQGVHQIDPAVV